jgi:two-component system, chemotaxis family, chemotaxis protein CheY
MPMKQSLIVDDSRIIRQVARRILEDLAFTAAEAPDCESALAACRRQMPDLILLDANIPNSSPVTFLRNLRSETQGEQPFVLLCTTENDVNYIAEALDAGADEYILKPFDRGLIEAKLNDAGLTSDLD